MAQDRKWKIYLANTASISDYWAENRGHIQQPVEVVQWYAARTTAPRSLWKAAILDIWGSDILVLHVAASDLPLSHSMVEVGAALGNGVPVLVVVDDLTVDINTAEPLGSWVCHPSVTLHVGSLGSLDFDSLLSQREV